MRPLTVLTRNGGGGGGGGTCGTFSSQLARADGGDLRSMPRPRRHQRLACKLEVEEQLCGCPLQLDRCHLLIDGSVHLLLLGLEK